MKMLFYLIFSSLLYCTWTSGQVLQDENDKTIIQNSTSNSQDINKFLEEFKKQINEEHNTILDSKERYEKEITNINKNLLEMNLYLKEELNELKLQMSYLIKIVNAKLEEEDEQFTKGRKGNTTNIWDALDTGSLQSVKFYYKEDPTILNLQNPDHFNFTPLLYSSRDNHYEIVKFLISAGANIESIDSYYEATPLLFATLFGHLRIMNHLLDNGANINFQNKFKSTALHLAVLNDHFHAVKLLIERGANKDLRDSDYLTPLEFAKRLLNRSMIVNYLSNLPKN